MYETLKDMTIYTFRNIYTGQVFTGIRSDFAKKHGLHKQGVSRLIRGERRHYQYWVLGSSKVKSIYDVNYVKLANPH